MFVISRFFIISCASFFLMPQFASPVFAQSDDAVPLKVSIGNVRSIIEVGTTEHVPYQLHVVVENVSDKPLLIWDQWNSWGYHNLSFSLEIENGKTLKLKRFGGLDWSQNAPDSIRLGPGEHYVFSVWLKPEDAGSRTNSWGPVNVRNGSIVWAKLQAHYEIPDYVAKEKGVWIGRISSKPKKIQLK